MIISGQTALKRAILTNLIDPTLQAQPCGIDVTLKGVFKWTGAGALDFSNALRRTPATEEIPFQIDTTQTSRPSFVSMPEGSYLVEFNERLDTPLDAVGHVYARSSLFRSGGLIHGGVCDSGYSGALGALLQVSHCNAMSLYLRACLCFFRSCAED